MPHIAFLPGEPKCRNLTPMTRAVGADNVAGRNFTVVGTAGSLRPTLGEARAPRHRSVPGKVRAGVAILAAFGLAACQNMAANTGIYYNEGLAESANSILLKNIIRAAKGYPTYYSALGDFSSDVSRDLESSPSIDIPFNVGRGSLIDGDIDINLAPSRSVTRDRNANASSLETEDFTQAIHTRIPPTTLLFFTEGRDPANRSLLLMLMTERLAVTSSDYRNTMQVAYQSCQERALRLSAADRGICRNLAENDPTLSCAAHSIEIDGTQFVSLNNDPTNTCEFTEFKLFIEALVVGNPNVQIQDDGTAAVTVSTESDTIALFEDEGTGLVLRSPHEIVTYLGKIVKQTFLGDDDDLLTVTSSTGEDIPIFVVEEGKDFGEASIAAHVDGDTFWIPKQSLRSVESHATFKALSILKDIISLNTAQNQLPTGPPRIVVD
ncbi:hypothetical protein [Bauldia sp.]|uniref:hypothetical protein n=1 Tax=Bauldia sp. TaxID=2575872 RepID=UPI003BA9A11E